MSNPSSSSTSKLKRYWTKDEDETLFNYINKYGKGCWKTVPESTGLSCSGSSCRFRWRNYLNPYINRSNITPDEEVQITDLHGLYGNRTNLDQYQATASTVVHGGYANSDEFWEGLDEYIHKTYGHVQSTNLDQYEAAASTVVHGGYANLPNSDAELYKYMDPHLEQIIDVDK